MLEDCPARGVQLALCAGAQHLDRVRGGLSQVPARAPHAQARPDVDLEQQVDDRRVGQLLQRHPAGGVGGGVRGGGGRPGRVPLPAWGGRRQRRRRVVVRRGAGAAAGQELRPAARSVLRAAGGARSAIGPGMGRPWPRACRGGHLARCDESCGLAAGNDDRGVGSASAPGARGNPRQPTRHARAAGPAVQARCVGGGARGGGDPSPMWRCRQTAADSAVRSRRGGRGRVLIRGGSLVAALSQPARRAARCGLADVMYWLCARAPGACGRHKDTRVPSVLCAEALKRGGGGDRWPGVGR